jgi:hypothetical protein
MPNVASRRLKLRVTPRKSFQQRCGEYRQAAELQKKAATMGGLAMDMRARGLKVRPVVTPPITAAFMLAEGDAGTRPPIVFVDDHSGGRRIGVVLMHMPTNVTVTHDRRRGSYY